MIKSTGLIASPYKRRGNQVGQFEKLIFQADEILQAKVKVSGMLFMLWTETPDGQEPRQFTDQEFESIRTEWAKRRDSGSSCPLSPQECEDAIQRSLQRADSQV